VELKFQQATVFNFFPSSFNQTKVELKFPFRYDGGKAGLAFNQTKVELKLATDPKTMPTAGLLIRPKWN